MTSPLFPKLPDTGGMVGRGTVRRTVEQLEQSTVLGDGVTRTTRGTFMRRGRRPWRPHWPGYAFLGQLIYFDAAFTSDPNVTVGSAIVDNSAGEKLWLVGNYSGNTVTWEQGPPPYPRPVDQDWRYVPDYTTPIDFRRS